MTTHWVLLADAGRARVLKSDELLESFEEVIDLIHPEARLPVADWLSDKPGRTWDQEGNRSAMDAHTDPKETEDRAFAEQIARALAEGLDAGRYERLVLVAPPRFLGTIRGVLSSQVSERVSLSIDRDYSRLPVHVLPSALHRNLPA